MIYISPFQLKWFHRVNVLNILSHFFYNTEIKTNHIWVKYLICAPKLWIYFITSAFYIQWKCRASYTWFSEQNQNHSSQTHNTICYSTSIYIAVSSGTTFQHTSFADKNISICITKYKRKKKRVGCLFLIVI